MNWDNMFIISISLFVLVLSIFTVIEDSKGQVIEYNGVKLSQEDYQNIKKVNEGNLAFDVCSLKNGNCTRFLNINEVKKIQDGN